MSSTHTLALSNDLPIDEMLVYNEQVLIAVLARIPSEGVAEPSTDWHVKVSFTPALRSGMTISNLEQWLNECDRPNSMMAEHPLWELKSCR